MVFHSDVPLLISTNRLSNLQLFKIFFIYLINIDFSSIFEIVLFINKSSFNPYFFKWVIQSPSFWNSTSNDSFEWITYISLIEHPRSSLDLLCAAIIALQNVYLFVFPKIINWLISYSPLYNCIFLKYLYYTPKTYAVL